MRTAEAHQEELDQELDEKLKEQGNQPEPETEQVAEQSPEQPSEPVIDPEVPPDDAPQAPDELTQLREQLEQKEKDIRKLRRARDKAGTTIDALTAHNRLLSVMRPQTPEPPVESQPPPLQTPASPAEPSTEAEADGKRKTELLGKQREIYGDEQANSIQELAEIERREIDRKLAQERERTQQFIDPLVGVVQGSIAATNQERAAAAANQTTVSLNEAHADWEQIAGSEEFGRFLDETTWGPRQRTLLWPKQGEPGGSISEMIDVFTQYKTWRSSDGADPTIRASKEREQAAAKDSVGNRLPTATDPTPHTQERPVLTRSEMLRRMEEFKNNPLELAKLAEKVDIAMRENRWAENR